MAAITKIANANVDTNTLIKATQIAGELLAGEALGVGAACFIDSDGLVKQTAPQTATTVHGFPPRDTASGEAVTLYRAMRIRWGSGLTPGAAVGLESVAGLPGQLDAAPTDVLGFVIDATDIYLEVP